jgi:hypothetical protein
MDTQATGELLSEFRSYTQKLNSKDLTVLQATGFIDANGQVITPFMIPKGLLSDEIFADWIVYNICTTPDGYFLICQNHPQCEVKFLDNRPWLWRNEIPGTLFLSGSNDTLVRKHLYTSQVIGPIAHLDTNKLRVFNGNGTSFLYAESAARCGNYHGNWLIYRQDFTRFSGLYPEDRWVIEQDAYVKGLPAKVQRVLSKGLFDFSLELAERDYRKVCFTEFDGDICLGLYPTPFLLPGDMCMEPAYLPYFRKKPEKPLDMEIVLNAIEKSYFCGAVISFYASGSSCVLINSLENFLCKHGMPQLVASFMIESIFIVFNWYSTSHEGQYNFISYQAFFVFHLLTIIEHMRSRGVDFNASSDRSLFFRILDFSRVIEMAHVITINLMLNGIARTMINLPAGIIGGLIGDALVPKARALPGLANQAEPVEQSNQGLLGNCWQFFKKHPVLTAATAATFAVAAVTDVVAAESCAIM